MSLHGLYPSTDAILLLHRERTYIGAVQRGLIFVFFFKNLNIAKTENLWHVTSRLLCLQLCTALMFHGLLLYIYVIMVCLHSTVYHDCAIAVWRGTQCFTQRAHMRKSRIFLGVCANYVRACASFAQIMLGHARALRIKIRFRANFSGPCAKK